MSDATGTRIDTAEVLAVDDALARSTGASDYGVTLQGFVAKPFARLLAEKLALSRALFGDDVDLSSGSAIRRLLEVSALEDARTWAALSSMYDNLFVVSATGEALSRLGDELGLPRPYLEARGTVKLTLTGTLPATQPTLTIPRGARLLTAGGHHVATDEAVTLSAASPTRDVAVVAFYPGPEHNLDPGAAAADGTFPQKVGRWNPADDETLGEFFRLRTAAGIDVTIAHTQRLTGGELQWPDARYRQLVLQAPRSLWTVDAVRVAVSLVPGVRQVQIYDGWGGLDLRQSIFGDFNFIDRLFSAERDLGSPYYFSVLVAPTAAAIWEGADGLRASVESAIEDLRPVGIFPLVQPAEEIAVGVEGKLVVQGLPLPSGSRQAVNASAAAKALKDRLLLRLREYVESLGFGEPVRAAEITWALMNEPGIVDVRELVIVSYPRRIDGVEFANPPASLVDRAECGTNVTLKVNQIATFNDDPSALEII